MKFHLSNLSKNRLRGVHESLIRLTKIAIQRTPVDFGIAWMGGRRSESEQMDLYQRGVTQKNGVDEISKHQYGEAIDILIYINGQPYEPKNAPQHYLIVIGVMFAVAAEIGIKIRSGANWDMDGEFLTDQDFDDLPHIEFVESLNFNV